MSSSDIGKTPWGDDGFLCWLARKIVNWKIFCHGLNSKDFQNLEEIFCELIRFGAEQATSIKCPKCDGSGAAGVDYFSGEEIECHYCDGLGQITADDHVQLTDRFDEMSGDYMASDHLNADRIQRLEELLRTVKSDLLVMHESPDYAAPLETVAMIDAVLKQETNKETN